MDKIVEHLDDDEEKKFFTPVKIILALFLVLLIVVMVIPEFSIKFDPEPKQIPKIDDVVPKDIKIIEGALQPKSYEEFNLLVRPNDPVIKQTADKISSIACSGNKICSAKAMFYFVRDNFDYMSDPMEYEYVKGARESLAVGGGDCDDASVLLVNLLEAIGLDARFVFIPEHVYVQVKVPGYKENRWLNLDPTCKNCEFNKVPYTNSKDILGIVD